MCGRFTLTTELAHLAERFGFHATDMAYTPSYNIAPGQPVLTMRHNERLQAAYCRWGLVPSWAKDPKIGHRMINARAETVADKPSFRKALRTQRCLILADGFYEWRQQGSGKSPMYIGLQGRQPFAFAGLWDVWRDPDGTPLYTCTILTTAANDLLRPIHERMPVILPPMAEERWLDQRLVDPQALLPMLEPYEAEAMQVYAVSRAVNSPHHNAPDCILPVPATPE